MDNNAVVGRIFDIQKFSTHDGPGIRTLVFLKGCILRCRWCCNPESQSYRIQRMISDGKEKVVGYDTTVGEVMKKVLQDQAFYRRSGGGMTLSGGEALCQPEFVNALLKEAKAHGVDTAIETTACLPFDMIAPQLPYLDTVLMDIKHVNSLKHEEYTGMRNELILANARKIAESGAHLIIRVPTIPGFNDTEEEIRGIARFAASLPGVQEIHLLPYHRLGYDKYVGLEREYGMGEVAPPDKDKMERLRRVAESEGLKAILGG
ncbi:MAG: glycyl-radical enzyme activating protein [Clostridia bacterium]|nr:glycyl-radical enzyme activating protein [Clostridia bacterium]